MIIYYSGAPGNRHGVPEVVLPDKSINVMFSFNDMKNDKPNARLQSIIEVRRRKRKGKSK